MTERQLERLASAGFELLPLPQILTHYVFERNGLVALVEKRPAGEFGNIGSAGMLIDGMFAVLVWKQERPFFVAKSREVAATEQEVENLRRFSSELHEALFSTDADH